MSEEAESRNAGKLTPENVDIPDSDLSVYQAIYRRRMAWRFKDTPVPRETINRLLETAVWAPNHRLTEPWRFFVIEKDSANREKVAQLAYDYSLEGSGGQGRAEAAKQKVLAPPILIYVYSKTDDREEITRENYASVCCAVQNISLAAVAEGLTATWETGRITRSPDLRKALGAKKKWQMVGALSIGVPDEDLNPPRTPVSEFTTWL
jgi:nitroreductase